MYKRNTSLLNRLQKFLDDLLFPYVRCIACGEETTLDENKLCEKCASDLYMQSFVDITHEGLRIIAPFSYSGPAGMLVRNLKFRRDSACVKPLADGMVRAVIKLRLKENCDYIIPVPISSRRFRVRGFNQSALLAKELGRRCSFPVHEESLKKIRHTKEQSKLKGRARHKNVIGAFKSKDVQGARILLVDDVFTTGATAHECAKALFESGAKEIIVLCASISQNNKSGQIV